MSDPIRIIVLDDDPNLVKTLGDIIKLKGYEPIGLSRGSEALARVKQENIAIAFIDLKLEDIGGLEVLKGIKKSSPETECILLTGYASQATAIEAINLGAYSYYQKPFDIDQLLLAVNQAVIKRQAKQELADSQQRYYTFINATTDMAFLKDEKFRYIIVNEANARFLGRQAAEIIGKDDFELMDARGARSCRQSDERALKENTTITSIEPVGGLFYETRKFPVPLQDGRMGVGGYIRDVTEVRTAQEAVRESENHYRGLFEDSPISLWEEDFSEVKKRLDAIKKKGVKDIRAYLKKHPEVMAECATLIRVVDVNKASLDLFHVSSKQELVKDLSQIFRADSYEQLREELANIADGKLQFEWEGVNYTPDGERLEIALTWSASPGHEEDLSRVIISLVDITERKKAEKSLQESEDHFRVLFEESPISLWEEDLSGVKRCLDGIKKKGVKDLRSYLRKNPHIVVECAAQIRILDVNQASVKLFRAGSKEELLKKHTQSFRDEFYDHFREELVEIAEGRTQIHWEGIHYTRDGKRLNIAGSMAVSPGHEADLSKVIVSIIDITERKKAENALSESEERFRGLFENTTVGIYRTTPKGIILLANPALITMLGYSDFTDLAKINLEVEGFGPDFARVDFRKKVESGEGIREYESHWKRKDGTFIYVRESARAIRDQMGTVLYYEGIVEEVTDRKLAEKAVAHSEEQLSLAMQAASDGYWDWNLLTDEIYYSPQWYRILGYEPDSLPGTYETFQKLLHPDDLARVEKVFTAARKASKGYDLEFRMQAKDGGWRWVRSRAMAVPVKGSKKAARMVGTHSDVTDRRLAEDALRKSEAEIRAVYESMTEMLALHQIVEDETGKAVDYRIINVNPAFESEMGIPASEAIGALASVLYGTGAAPYLELYADVARTGIPQQFETVFEPLGKHFSISVFSPEPGTFATVATDITERKRADEAVRASEEKYRSLIETTGVGAAYFTLNGTLLLFNRKAASYMGGEPEDFHGKSMSELYGDIASEYLRRLKAAATSPVSLDFEDSVQLPIGKKWFVSNYSRVADASGTIIGVQVLSQDITAGKAAEEALRESEQRLQTVLSTTPAGIGFVVDRVLKYVTDHLCAMTGYAREELLEQSARMLYPTDEEYEFVGSEKYRQIRESGIGTVETRWKTKDGEILEIILSSSPIDPEDWSRGIVFTAVDITDRKHAEELLAASENKFRRVIEESVDGIVVTNETGTVIEWNQGQEKITGIPRVEALGRKIWDVQLELAPSELRTPENRALIQRMAEDFQKTGNAPFARKPLDTKIVTRTGEERIMQSVAFPIQTQYGFMVTAMARDITEERKAQDQLRMQGAALNAAANAIVISDREGNIEWVNPAFEALTGYGIGDVMMKKPSVLKSGAQTKAFYQDLWDTILSGKVFRGQLINRRKDGSTYNEEMTITPLKDSKGGITHFIAIKNNITDIVERKQELEALSQVSEALRVASSRDEMVPIILEQVQTLLHSSGALLNWMDEESQEINVELGVGVLDYETGKRFPIHTGVSGLILDTGERYVTEDIYKDGLFLKMDNAGTGIKSLVGYPLINMGKPIGVILAGRVMPFTEPEQRLLGAVANMAINAMQRASLHEQTEQRLRHLVTLREIDRTITTSLDLQTTLGVILSHTLAQLGMDAACVLLVDEEKQELYFGAGLGFGEARIDNVRLKLGEDHAGRAAKNNEPAYVANLQDPKNQFKVYASDYTEFVSYYVVPMAAKGKVNGVMELFHRTPLQLDAEKRDFLDLLMGQAAIAVDNARMFSDLQKSNEDLRAAYDATIEGWVQALDLRDKETEGHTLRVADLAVDLAREMGQSEDALTQMRRGALLHDIGKMAVPDAILNKPAGLTDEEWVVMRKHPEYANDMLAGIEYLKPALEVPYCHHEKWDGSGYPRGLKGTEIPLPARIFAVIDVWDALCSDRPYRPAWKEEDALKHIREQSGVHFDPEVVEKFIDIMQKKEFFKG